MPRISERVRQLELEISYLKTKITDLSKNTEETTIRPYTKAGGLKDSSQVRPSDISTGLGATFGGNLIWNDAELQFPPYGQQPTDPTKGYNKHGHSRYAGGALDIHTLELVEYETNDEEQIVDSSGNPLNKHCQQFWKKKPNIKTDGDVPKIGLLDIEFEPSTRKWIAGAGMIDIERTYLVQYVWKKYGQEVPAGTEGAIREIKKDKNNNEMKSPLLYTEGSEEENLNKSNVVWIEDEQCWKFYAVYKPILAEVEEK